MKNNNQINDVRDALFAQLTRLSDVNCNLDKESVRTKAMVSVTNQIINSAKVEIDAFRLTGAPTSDFMPSLQVGAGKKQKQLSDGTGTK